MMPKYLETKTRINRKTGKEELIKVAKNLSSPAEEVKRAKGFTAKTLKKVEALKKEQEPKKLEIRYLPGMDPKTKTSRWEICLQANKLLESEGCSPWTGKKIGVDETIPSAGQVMSFLKKEAIKSRREQKKAEKVALMIENLKKKSPQKRTV